MGQANNQVSKHASAQELEQMRDFITFRISRLLVKLNAQSSEILRKSVGLTLVEWRAISFVAMLQPTGVAELSHELGHDKGLLSRTIKKLRDKGLVFEERDSEDSRRSRVSLSPKGLALHSNNLPTMRKRQAALLSGISEQDKAALMRALNILEENSKLRDF